MCTHIYTCAHTYTSAHIHTHVCAHTYTHTQIHTCTHTHTCTHVHTNTHTHMHTYPYTHVHTRTHTHTYAHTPLPPFPRLQACRHWSTPAGLDTATVLVFSRTYILDSVILFLFSIYLICSLSCFLSSTGCGFILLVFSSLMSTQYLRPFYNINILESCQSPYQPHPTKASFGLVSLDRIWDFFPHGYSVLLLSQCLEVLLLLPLSLTLAWPHCLRCTVYNPHLLECFLSCQTQPADEPLSLFHSWWFSSSILGNRVFSSLTTGFL